MAARRPSDVPRSEELFASLPSGIDICHQTFGESSDPAVLLVMGLGGPMGWWDTAFCERLARRGFFVIRYDNRDTGRSTKLRQHRVNRHDLVRAFVPLPRVRVGPVDLRVKAPYGIADLADDAYGLLDHLGLESAHVAGVSMGGMIAQTMAIARPERVTSLVSIMSTTGRRTVGWQDPRVLLHLLKRTEPTREAYIERAMASATVIGSPEHPADPVASRLRAEVTYDRGWSSSGVLRHMLAVLTQPDRTTALSRLDVPTTVVHGLADRLVHRSGGAATAAAVPGAQHVEVPGMGHDLPEALWDTYVDAIADTAARADSR